MSASGLQTHPAPESSRLGRMLISLRDFRLPLIMVLCIILGGTSQTMTGLKLPIYVASLAGVFWVLWDDEKRPMSKLWVLPYGLLGAFIAVNLLSLIVLPPEIWTRLPGREVLVEGYRAAGMELPKFTLSMAPEKSIFSILHFVPVLAILVITVISPSDRERYYAFLAVLIAAGLSVLLGLMQEIVSGGDLYLYKIAHFKSAAGFFSNANHQATLLVLLLPFTLLYLGRLSFGRDTEPGLHRQRLLLSVTLNMLLLIGIVLTDSLAGYALVLIQLVLLLPLLFKRGTRNKRMYFAAAIGILLLFLLDFLYLGNFVPELINEVEATHGTSRQTMTATTLTAAKHYLPLGTGPGTFQHIYGLFEPVDNVSKKFANQAHNEYVQVLMEQGIMGAVIIALSVILLITRLFKSVFRSSRRYSAETLGYISLLSVAVHSVADYPLRTIAVSAVAVFILAMSQEQGFRQFRRQ